MGPDEARERAIFNKLRELEKKHDFTTTQYLKHFTQVSELLEPTEKDKTARVKPADKMLMLQSLFDGEKPEKVKTHYEWFNQYIKLNYGNYCGRGGHGHCGNFHRPRGCRRGNYRGNNNYKYHQYYTHDDGTQFEQYGPPCALCGGFNHSP